jgi:hypothetical protein
MKIYTNQHANKVIVSTRFQYPDPGVPERVLVIEANIPLSGDVEGYDSAKAGNLLDFAWATMEELQTAKVEIFPLTEPNVGYIVSRDSTALPRSVGP